MYCKYCGTQIDDDSRFCSACGKSLAPAAPAYTAPAQPGAPAYTAPVQPAAPAYTAPAQPGAPVYMAPVQPAAPVYTAPDQPGAPVYTAPVQSAAPVYTAPAQPALSKGFPMVPLILALALAAFLATGDLLGLVLRWRAITLASVFSSLVATGGAVLLVLDLFGLRKQDTLFFGIGLLCLALSCMPDLFGRYWYEALFLALPAYALGAVYHISRGKLFGGFFRFIAAGALWTECILCFCTLLRPALHHMIPFYPFLVTVLTFGLAGTLIFLYRPYGK